MPKMKCTCGEIINLGGIPSPHQYLFISDTDFDQFQDTIEAEEVYLKMKICIQCPLCLRLHIYKEGFDRSGQIYLLEKE
ncbi:hypothetical protein HX004_07830 [Myroides sp. 1354]|uniref:hypothetical protein n=1 Tax=unclassified Myroides TaxID=2642485 RepID=UPI00257793A6|nr:MULTISPECIES: hypothetical protein [unclassified Myroides]MDM1044970.1 hypothetical protein [Myroides sp. R163-1]MDM1055683.1 hypothetical protein [Myroides sp. 1354]MDM1068980.1 hypothetical protein [Myroides sp. 1372]